MSKINRRTFIESASLFTAGAVLSNKLVEPAGAQQKDWLLYVGTYTSGKAKSEGIYIYRMSAATGELKREGIASGIVDPSFLAVDPSRRYLYAANETGNFLGKKNGGVTSFAIDQKTGALQKLNEVSAPGVPCHVSVPQSGSVAGKFVAIADYGGGNVAMYPVKADGSLGEASDVAQHSGKGGDPKRQEGPHTHSANFDAAGRYVFAPDLGIDKVMIYKVDATQGKLVPNGFAATKPGAGPRHFDFHPSGKFGYVISELDSTVTAFAYDKSKGALKELQTISTLPANYKQTSYCADIHVHPSGKFLYGSNRGHNSIVIYSIDPGTGKLTLLGHQSTRGDWPRNFGIDPAGQYLLAANQNSNTVASFRINAQTGLLTAVGNVLEIPAPVCLKFIPAFS